MAPTIPRAEPHSNSDRMASSPDEAYDPRPSHHWRWDNSLAPVVTVEPGDTIEVEVLK